MGTTAVNLSKPPRLGVHAKSFSALLLYAVLSVYLFGPYLRGLSGYQWLDVINPVAAGWGCYFLSRRWLNHWTPSLLAGAVYGFSPFGLTFAAYPVAALSFVMVPWLLLPAVFWHHKKPADTVRFLIRAVFALLPFAGVVLFFWISSQKWAGPHFLMPVNLHLTAKHFYDVFFPLFRGGPYLTFGMYHAPLILSLMGLFVLVMLQRISVVVPVAVGLVLCFLEPLFQVSPIVWAAIPVLFLSLLAGLGFESILSAGKSDGKWVLACAIGASILAAFFGGLAFKRLILGGLLERTAMMYAITAAGLWLVFFFIQTGHRWGWSRWIVLTATVGIDLIFSSRYLVDKLF